MRTPELLLSRSADPELKQKAVTVSAVEDLTAEDLTAEDPVAGNSITMSKTKMPYISKYCTRPVEDIY